MGLGVVNGANGKGLRSEGLDVVQGASGIGLRGSVRLGLPA